MLEKPFWLKRLSAACLNAPALFVAPADEVSSLGVIGNLNVSAWAGGEATLSQRLPGQACGGGVHVTDRAQCCV